MKTFTEAIVRKTSIDESIVKGHIKLKTNNKINICLFDILNQLERKHILRHPVRSLRMPFVTIKPYYILYSDGILNHIDSIDIYNWSMTSPRYSNKEEDLEEDIYKFIEKCEEKKFNIIFEIYYKDNEGYHTLLNYANSQHVETSHYGSRGSIYCKLKNKEDVINFINQLKTLL